MDRRLSVVISTLNDREHLLSCLDGVAAECPDDTECIVVNGPSSDGTTGAVRERDDVDVLVEISDRTANVSRNTGFELSTGDVVAFLGDEYVVEPGWYDSIANAFEGHTDVLTGPVKGGGRRSDRGTTPSSTVGRPITVFEGANVAIDRTVLEALDGFDEYVPTNDAIDCSHRVSGIGFDVTWNPEMAVRSDVGTDGGRAAIDWRDRYRSLGYRLTKNYGPRPSVFGHIACSAIRDAGSALRGVVAGEATPTNWLGNGVDVCKGTGRGVADGLRARYADRTSTRNPNGVSSRQDRAVQIYDRRDGVE